MTAGRLVRATASALLAGVIPLALAAQQRVGIRSTRAARTTVVLQARVNTEIVGTHDGAKLLVHGGGQVDWLPRLPFTVVLGLNQTLAGDVKQNSFEIGGGWRLRDALGTEDAAIIMDGRVIGDTMYTALNVGARPAHRYTTLRAGLLGMSAPAGGLAQPNATSSTAVYVGIAKNALLNETTGQLGFRIVRTSAIDLLFGSADSLALRKNTLGVRAYLARDVGSVVGWRWEVGIRPGFGFYTYLSADFYCMLLDVLR